MDNSNFKKIYKDKYNNVQKKYLNFLKNAYTDISDDLKSGNVTINKLSDLSNVPSDLLEEALLDPVEHPNEIIAAHGVNLVRKRTKD